MTVPCGQCIGCRIERSRQWALRCVHEAKLHARSCFITLTYNDESLPSDLSLKKEDLQKFFKRLRKECGKFRYFACGEYGDENKRPHYHAIIFGLDFSDDRVKHSITKRGDVLYRSEALTRIWANGHAIVSTFTYATAAYTARYIMKKRGGKLKEEAYQRVNLDTGELWYVIPEFATMSLKPGLGTGWYDKFKSDAFPSDFLVHDGKKHPVPRFYFEKLKKEDGQCASVIKATRKKQLSESPDNSPDRLYARELCKESQLTQLKRSI